MAIKALFPEGTTTISLAPLYQWDYGQELEIEAAGLPSLIEVHFACNGMNEAVVHTCSCVGNIATVAIPDRCLEQPNEITAWVYEIDGTAGRTIYSIYIPIIARTRPARSESIPQSVQDTYTQLITEVNELLDALQSGSVRVGYANTAASALNAAKAANADTATSANTAGIATNAINDANGDKISDTYMKLPKDYEVLGMNEKLPVGLYHFILVYNLGDTPNTGSSFYLGLGNNDCYPLMIYSPLMSIDDVLLRIGFSFAMQEGYAYAALEVGFVSDGRFEFSAIPDVDIEACTLYYKKMD